MFGLRDEFRYQECSSCGCLQIADIPKNITKYYPPYYYSFTHIIPPLKILPFFKRLFKGFRLKKKYKQDKYALKNLKPIHTGINDRILDVGCGKGQLICELFNLGFENVEGVDKFLPSEIDYGYGVKVMKKDLSELQQDAYDIILMNHVLEHMDQQKEELVQCRALLKEDGCLIVRIPVIGDAWDRYQGNWVQLDAPRHFFLHTVKSMNILAEDSGFEIKKTIFDSTGFQFWGSELYRRDIPLFVDDEHHGMYPVNKVFSSSELQDFEKEAEQLNLKGRGDSAAFYLYKK
ncbi:methyltransferase family protein [Pedobacter metabolipauper]|uniref:Methyltransferase family protein n=2 Tax=Pedobacter metabolipauper TaxID=425513 RepID=A0A4R6T2J6_9SPHI|nr:methyltransferase family protein [Pedobacter metabolipauper]